MNVARYLSAFSTIGSPGLTPPRRSPQVTSPLIPGALSAVQLPSSRCVVRKNSIARARAAATRAWSIPDFSSAALPVAIGKRQAGAGANERIAQTSPNQRLNRERTGDMRLLPMTGKRCECCALFQFNFTARHAGCLDLAPGQNVARHGQITAKADGNARDFNRFQSEIPPPKSLPFHEFDADKNLQTCYQNWRQDIHLGHGGADGGSPFTDVDGGDVRAGQEAARRQILSRRPDAGTSVPLQPGVRRLRQDSVSGGHSQETPLGRGMPAGRR